MVYVALGLAVASLCSVCYAYKHYLWARIRPPSQNIQILPEISVGAADERHTKDASSTDDEEEVAEIRLLTEASTGKNHTATENGMTQLSADEAIKQHHHQPAKAEYQKDHSVEAAPSDATKLVQPGKNASNAAHTITNPSMPPPARPGPRLRPKADKPATPSTNTQPRNINSLGVPQTASSLRPLPSGGASSLQPPPSLASTLRTPPSRSPAAPSSSLAPTSSTLPSSARPSKKVLLSPGHSPLDWAHLTSHPPSSTFLRGADVPPSLIRVPPSLLKYHNGRKGKNAWGVWQGKVYNLTPYMDFHPGGVDQLMKGAGREKDGERLFLEIHPWVNWENMLGECLVGILVSEEEAGKDEGGLENMD
ncbi:MAG: hypothetical protein LQ337_006099 [Flavoplaca oasis]|nr:MAG: hypothetical protein LQ337_006099 [Flavoplaca oasis]